MKYEYTEIPDIPYKQPQDRIRLLDMYLPKTDESFPVFIYFHGGGLEGGSRGGSLENLFRSLVGSGIGAVSADYRLYPNARFPDFINDAAAAVAFVSKYGKEHGFFNKIIVGGSSAGAYLAMMLCFNSRYYADAGIGSSDICGYVFDAGQPTVHFNVLKERGFDTRRILIDEASPIFYIDEAFINSGYRPQMLFITADNDMPCRYEQNRMMIKNLEHFNYDMSKVEFILMEGYAHCEYVRKQNDSGTWIFAETVKRFINGIN